MSKANIISAIALLGSAINELASALNDAPVSVAPDTDTPDAVLDKVAKANVIDVLRGTAAVDTTTPTVAPAPTPTRDMGAWITDRRPTRDDADARGKVWVIDDESGDVIAGNWDGSCVNAGLPWQPIVRPNPLSDAWRTGTPEYGDGDEHDKVWVLTQRMKVLLASTGSNTALSCRGWLPVVRPTSPWTEDETARKLDEINNG